MRKSSRYNPCDFLSKKKLPNFFIIIVENCQKMYEEKPYYKMARALVNKTKRTKNFGILYLIICLML